MSASIPSLIKTVSVNTLLTKLKSRKHSKSPALHLTFVPLNSMSNKRGKSPKKIVMTHRKSTENEKTRAFKQHSYINKSFALQPIFAAGGIEPTLNHMSKWILIGFFYSHLAKDDKTGATFIGLKIGLWNAFHPCSVNILNVFMANLSLMEFLEMNGSVATIAGIILAFGSYFSWLRISQQDHTVSQLMVGVVTGSIFSVFWFWLWGAIMVKAFFSYLWIRLMLLFGGLGTSLLLTLRCFRDWNLEAK